jgi:ABC-type nickel/cobalt efflux system permease component RcnA
MLDRAAFALIMAAAACAVAVMAVFAGGFALFSWLAPTAGAAGAAGIVALVSALIIAGVGIFILVRAKQHKEEAEAAKAEVMDALPHNFTDLAADRPLMSLAASVIGGVLIARYPSIARDLMSIVARFTDRSR